jgi:hypothetical protein
VGSKITEVTGGINLGGGDDEADDDSEVFDF